MTYPSRLSNVFIATVLMAGCPSDRPVLTKAEPPNATAVKTVAVTNEQVRRTTSQPATVHAYFQADIRAKASGFVREIQADLGDFVRKGEPLAIIDIPEMRKQREVMQARLARSEAEEQRAKAGVDLAIAEVESAKAEVEQAKSEMSGAEASLAASEAEFERTDDLVRRGSLQNRMLDEALKRRDSERATRDSIESLIRSTESKVNVAAARRASAEADLRASKAETDVVRRQLDELDVMIDYATITAPFDGIVTDRKVEPGDLIGDAGDQSDREPLFVLSQISRVRVRIPVPEADAPMIDIDDPVAITFPSFKDEPTLNATVTRFAGGLDPSTRTMMVEVEVDNADRKLMPGMFGQATIELDSNIAASMLPARAIRFDETGNAYVYVIDPNRVVSRVDIITGLDDGNTIEVVSGVEAGQEVIDANLKRFADGEKVVLLDP